MLQRVIESEWGSGCVRVVWEFEGWGLRDFLIKGEGLSKKCRRS